MNQSCADSELSSLKSWNELLPSSWNCHRWVSDLIQYIVESLFAVFHMRSYFVAMEKSFMSSLWPIAAASPAIGHRGYKIAKQCFEPTRPKGSEGIGTHVPAQEEIDGNAME
jgi:hypothetical protein